MSDDKNKNIKWIINVSDVFNKYKGMIIGIIFIIVGMLFYLIMQVFNLWTNPPAAGPSIFCEYFDPDLLVGEPINAWSNFYYVGAGMLVIAYYDLIQWMVSDYGFDKLDAYFILGQVGQVHLGNMVNPNYTVGAFIEKKYLS